MPGLNQGYRSKLLTNVMVKYQNKDFIAEELFPVLPVKKDLNWVFVFDKENLRPPKNSARGLYDRAERVDNNLKQVPLPPLIERSLEQPVAWKFRNQADDPFDPMIDATNNVTEKIAIEKEVALANYLANTANVPYSQTLSGSAQWSDYTTGVSDPMKNAQTAATSILLNGFQKANVVAMGRNVYDWLINHPKVIARMQYSQQTFGDDVENAFARILRVNKILVGDAVYNNSQSGQADSMGFIWGNHIWWMYVAPVPALYTTTAGYHLIIPEERYVDSWTEVPIKSDLVRCNDYYTRYTFSPECIYALFNVVSGPA